jgi:hypothetical protein
MIRSYSILMLALFFSLIAFSQNYQVTNIQGIESLDPPVLDIQNGTARITHSNNFWFYSFPASGPTDPIPTSSAIHPRPIDYGAYNVAMKSSGNSIVISYIIQEDSPTPGWYAEAVASPDGGSTWTTPHVFEEVAPIPGSLSLYYDNVVLEKAPAGTGTALLYYRAQGDYNRIHMTNNHGFGPVFGPIGLFPGGDSIHAASNFSCYASASGPNDNIFNVYSIDTTLYLIRHNPPAAPDAPATILNISGSGSYFTRTRLVGNPNGTLYLAYGFWQLIPGEGMSHTMSQGTVLYKSTNSGSTWSFADTISQTQYAVFDLQMTSTGTLVHVKAENANVYVRSSLDGSSWSSFTQVNPTANTATGKNTFGISTALVDDSNIGIAWIDTTTGYDEIFYRKMDIPTPPAAGVTENARLDPMEFTLYQNYPNPFNPTTQIRFSLTSQSIVSLKVFDVLGREVKILASGKYQSGPHTVTLDASALPSGVYFYRLQAGTFTAVRKLTLLK